MRAKTTTNQLNTDVRSVAPAIIAKQSQRTNQANSVHWWIALASMAVPLIASPVMAEQKCWPVKQVMAKHAQQGDEIVLTFRSWIGDGLATIIYHDPSDGVVTEIVIHTNGTACIADVGEELRVLMPRQATSLPGGRQNYWLNESSKRERSRPSTGE